MKKILYLSLLLLFILSGCRDDNDPAPGERPEERLSKALSDYKARLVGAEHGWKAILYSGSGGAYSFHMRFLGNDRVVMSGDINTTTATAMESTYRLKTMQRPSLLFDTYSYLHILSDPDPNVSGGETGAGLGTDFEFAFESATPETITLRGNFRGSRLELTRATREEADSFISSLSAQSAAFDNMNRIKTYFKRLTIGSNAFDLSVNTRTRSISFSYSVGNELRRYTTNYYFTPTGITLLEPLTVNNLTISEINNLQYNAGTNSISVRVNNVNGSIRESNVPAAVNVQGARDLIANRSGEYWITGGFQTADDEDLYKVFTIPNMYFILLWPKISSRNNVAFDLLGFVLRYPDRDAVDIAYGPTATSTVSSDGRIIFRFNGNLEDFNSNFEQVPPAYKPIVQATADQWTDAQGYYYVNVSESEAVLVSARDAKIWMTLFR